MKERGIVYPTAYNTPHLDPDTMRPYRPTFELIVVCVKFN